MLRSAFFLTQYEQKPNAQTRQAELVEVIKKYEKSLDELFGTLPKQPAEVSKKAAALPGVAAATVPVPLSTEPPAIRSTRMPAEDFRRAVLDWRKKNGWSQSQAAAQLAISVRTLQDWEQGRCPPSQMAEVFVMRHILGTKPVVRAASTPKTGE